MNNPEALKKESRTQQEIRRLRDDQEARMEVNRILREQVDTLQQRLREVEEALERLASPAGFVANGIIPKDQWGQELQARLDFASQALTSDNAEEDG